jgi:hypothetical protein
MDLVIDISLYITYVVFAVALAAMVVFSVLQVIKNFKKSKIALLGLLAIVVLFCVFYFFFSSTAGISNSVIEKTGSSELMVKIVDAGLMLTYAIVVVGVIAMIASYIYVKVKK